MENYKFSRESQTSIVWWDLERIYTLRTYMIVEGKEMFEDVRISKKQAMQLHTKFKLWILQR